MIKRIKNFDLQSVRHVIMHLFRKIKPYPYRITLSNYIEQGCKFEVTTPMEEGRVCGIGDEEDFLRLFMEKIQPSDVFFDIGSCVGLYALHAALSGAKVIAFEPDPYFRKRLITNISLNKLQGSIQIMDYAVSDKKGKAVLYTDGVEGRSPSLCLIGERGSVIVNTNSIDNAIAEGILPMPTFMKMDIEGAEILALHGMKQLLSSKDAPRYLFIELHPDFLKIFLSSVEECVTIIESFGYVVEYNTPRADQLHFIYRKNKF